MYYTYMYVFSVIKILFKPISYTFFTLERWMFFILSIKTTFDTFIKKLKAKANEELI